MSSTTAPVVRALPTSNAVSDTVPQRELFGLINRVRTEAGLPALRWDDRIANAALNHARIMAAEGRLSHQYENEQDLLGRLTAQEMRFDSASENVVYDLTAQGAHEAFMGSAKHHDNIFNPAYDSVGIAAVNVGGILYIVEDFAHEVSDVKDDDAATQIASQLAKMRESAGAKNVPFVGDARVQQAAAKMAEKESPDSALSLSLPNARFAGSYATRDISTLPTSVARLTTVNGISSYSVGVRYARTPKYPSGLFWVTIVMFDEAKTLSRK
jgi:hypothetical protein